MAAARDQQAGLARGDDRCAQIDPGDRAARAFADAVLIGVERDHQRGLAGLLLDPPGDDPDHAGMPAAPGQDQHRAVVLAGDLRFGGFLHRRLDRAAFLVEPRELRGDVARFVGVLGGQQPHAQRRFADPAAGIDPGAERKAEVAAGGRAGQPAGIDQRGHADVFAPGHDLEPLRDKGAVEPVQRGDIGDRAQRDQIEQGEQVGLGLRRRR